MNKEQILKLQPGDRIRWAGSTPELGTIHSVVGNDIAVKWDSGETTGIDENSTPACRDGSDNWWWENVVFHEVGPLSVGTELNMLERVKQLKVGDVFGYRDRPDATVVGVTLAELDLHWRGRDGFENKNHWGFKDIPTSGFIVKSLTAQKKPLHLPVVVNETEELGRAYPYFNASTMRLHLGSRVGWSGPLSGGVIADFGTVTELNPKTFQVTWEGVRGFRGLMKYEFEEHSLSRYIQVINNVPPLRVGETIITADRAKLLRAGDVVRNVSNTDPVSNVLTVTANTEERLSFSFKGWGSGRLRHLDWYYSLAYFRKGRWCGELKVISLAKDRALPVPTNPAPVDCCSGAPVVVLSSDIFSLKKEAANLKEEVKKWQDTAAQAHQKREAAEKKLANLREDLKNFRAQLPGVTALAQMIDFYA